MIYRFLYFFLVLSGVYTSSLYDIFDLFCNRLVCDKQSVSDTATVAYDDISGNFADYMAAVEYQSHVLTDYPVFRSKFLAENFVPCESTNSTGYYNMTDEDAGDFMIMYIPPVSENKTNWNESYKQEMLDILSKGDTALQYLHLLLNSPSSGITVGDSPYIDMTWPKKAAPKVCDYGYSDDIWHNEEFFWAYLGNEEMNPTQEPYISPPYVSENDPRGKMWVLAFCALLHYKGERIGSMSSELNIIDYFDVFSEKYSFTKNSHIICILEGGDVVYAHNYTLEQFFHKKEGESEEEKISLYNIGYFQDQSEDFKFIYKLLKMNESELSNYREYSERIIPMTMNGIKYYVTWSPKVFKTLYMVFITPLSDLTKLASWKSNQSIITFRYNTGDTTSTSSISIHNEGELPLTIELRKELGSTNSIYSSNIDIYKEIGQGETYTFNITVDLTQCLSNNNNNDSSSSDGGCSLPFISITNTQPTTGKCYKDISFNAVAVLNDCKLSNIDMKFKKCKNTDLPVRIFYKEPHICTKGIKIPDNDVNIPCDNISSSYLFYIEITVAVITFIVSILLFCVFFLRKYLAISLTTQRTYIFSGAFGYVLITISFIILTGTSGDISCWVGIYLFYLANVFLASAHYCISNHSVQEEIKKIMILEPDYLIFLKRFGLIFIVTAVLSISLYQNKFTNEYIIEGIPIYYETCGADQLNMVLALACSILMFLLSLIDCVRLLRSKIEKQLVYMTVGVVVGDILFIVVDLLFALHGVSLGDAFAIVIIDILISLIYYFSIPTFIRVRMSNKIEVGPYTSINATYTAILADPISRYCLMFHMRDLHLEENIYYFLDSIKFFKIANNPNTDPKKLRIYTQKMVDKYIKDDGKYQVNISDSLKEEILKTAQEKGPDAQLFEKVDEEVLQLIIQNCGQSFLGSIHATKAKDLLRWFNGFEQMNAELQDAVVEKIVGYKEDQQAKNKDGGEKNGGYSVFTQNESAELAFQAIRYTTLTQRTTKTVLIRTCGSHPTTSATNTTNTPGGGDRGSINRISNTHIMANNNNRSSHAHHPHTSSVNNNVSHSIVNHNSRVINRSSTLHSNCNKSKTDFDTPVGEDNKNETDSEKKDIQSEGNPPLPISVASPVEPLNS